MFRLAVFDVAGTILSDDGVVIHSFEAAFEAVVPEVWEQKREAFTDFAQKTMGQSKIEVFFALLGDQRLAEACADRFQREYLLRLKETRLFPGIEQMFAMLRTNGIKIALNTGFNRDTLNQIIGSHALEGLIDVSVTPQEAGAGRPSPAMIRLSAQKLGVEDPKLVAVLGDTATDIETAKSFGAGLSIGVLTGAHNSADFEAVGADLVLERATDALPHLLR